MVICLMDYDNATVVYTIPHDVSTNREKCQKVAIDNIPSTLRTEDHQTGIFELQNKF